MSLNPARSVTCPLCKSTGFVKPMRCPYDSITEFTCNQCPYEDDCGGTTSCDCNAGYVDESDLDNLLKWRDYEG